MGIRRFRLCLVRSGVPVVGFQWLSAKPYQLKDLSGDAVVFFLVLGAEFQFESIVEIGIFALLVLLEHAAEDLAIGLLGRQMIISRQEFLVNVPGNPDVVFLDGRLVYLGEISRVLNETGPSVFQFAGGSSPRETVGHGCQRVFRSELGNVLGHLLVHFFLEGIRRHVRHGGWVCVCAVEICFG